VCSSSLESLPVSLALPVRLALVLPLPAWVSVAPADADAAGLLEVLGTPTGDATTPRPTEPPAADATSAAAAAVADGSGAANATGSAGEPTAVTPEGLCRDAAGTPRGVESSRTPAAAAATAAPDVPSRW
jgi:hypothetical protein